LRGRFQERWSGGLTRYQHDDKLVNVAKEALRFVAGSEINIQQSGGAGQSSFGVVRMYKVRMGLEKFRREAFVGLDESLKVLGECDIVVHLSVIQTKSGVISIWLPDEEGPPVGIIIANFAWNAE
jgi:hypothetical protein